MLTYPEIMCISSALFITDIRFLSAGDSMRAIINQLIQLEELILIRDEQHVAVTDANAHQQIDEAIKTMQSQLPPDVASMFLKLYKKDHNFIVRVHDNVCSACRMHLPTSVVQAVRMAKQITVCPSCARILYYVEGAPRHVARSKVGSGYETVGIARFSAPSLMIPRLESTDKAGVIRELAYRMEYEGFVDGADKLVGEALRRESILSTVVEHGIAFPHVRGVEGGGLTLALGLSPKGIHFEPSGKQLTHIVFFIVIPTVASAFYLRLLAGLTEAFSKSEARKALLEEKEPEKLWKTLMRLTRSTVK